MRLRITKTVLLFAFFCIISVVSHAAQNNDNGIVTSDIIPPEPICSSTESVPVVIEAQDISESADAVIKACGNVLFLTGTKRLTASQAIYNIVTMKGSLHNATFTTCRHQHPDYIIKADEVTLLSNNRIRLHGVSLYLGRTKVLALPMLKMRIGSANSTTALFPKPGYSKYDGYTLSQKLRLIDTNKTQTNADLVLTTKNGLEGEFNAQYGFDGNIGDFPGRYFGYDSLINSAFRIPQSPVEECDPQSLRPKNISRLRAFGIFSLKQRAYDVRNEGLIVYRQPDIGLNYIGKQINPYSTRLDPRIELYPEINTDWGRFKEEPGVDDFINRENISVTVPVNLLPLGESTAFQPLFQYSKSTYSDNETYQTTAYAADLAHIYKNGSFISGRYIKRNATGETPFQFDDIDMVREWQTAIQIKRKPHILGFVSSYNLDQGNFYDWEVMYGYQTDCITAWLEWHQRAQHISMEIKLINM